MAYNQEKLTTSLTPVKLGGETVLSYFLDSNGDIYSTAYAKFHCYEMWARKIRSSVSGNTKYPMVTLSINEIPKKISVHKVVAETFIDKPLPPGVSKKDWKNTPQSVKNCFNHFWEVNHIDHDPLNYDPLNLEWVSRFENKNKYQEHRKAS